MHIKVLQTSDPFVYYDFFEVTSRVNRAFCQHWALDYLGYVGLRVGRYPWHATYNRIPLLNDAVREGFRGWIIYLDADAYFASMDFNIGEFLDQRSAYSMIAAPGGEEVWNINAGILLLNLASPFTRSVIAKWNDAFETNVGHERLLEARLPWQDGIKDDQVLLHETLSQEQLHKELLVTPLREIGAPSSSLIRQVLRQHGSTEDRTRRAKQDIEKIMGKAQIGGGKEALS